MWLGIIEEYFPFQQGLDYVWMFLVMKLAVSGLTLRGIITTASMFLGWKVIMEVIRNTIGIFDYKRGIWAAEMSWGSKNKQYNIYSIQLIDTLKAICNKLGIEHYFKEMEQDDKPQDENKVIWTDFLLLPIALILFIISDVCNLIKRKSFYK